MSFRIWRRIRICPGLTLNLSKTAIAISIGVPGLRLTVGTAGARVTIGGWGTGIFWTRRLRAARPEVEPA